MSEERSGKVTPSLECYRCSKIATVYVPETQRVLCDNHFEVFAEAYEHLRTSAVKIDEYLVESIANVLPVKESADLDAGIDFNRRVPVTLIVDHMAELATGVEPATCKVCGKPMQLHAQWETTKQQFMGSSSEGAMDPDFLDNFDEFGNCLSCRNPDGMSLGFHLVDLGMSKNQLIAHLNGHNHKETLQEIDADPDPQAEESGNVHLMEILGSPMGTVTRKRAKELNFPIYVDDHIVYWNPDHRAKKPINFPMGMEDFNGMTLPSYNWFHSFLDHITGNFTAPNSCGNCNGEGHYPDLYNPEVQAAFEERRVKAQEAPKIQERAEKRQRLLDKATSKISHSAPGMKPHDHHHKKNHYSPRKNGPLGRSGAGMIPTVKGPGKAAFVKAVDGNFPKMALFPPVERWWYDQMNMFHDITHTEYKTPSYMYRNPNPMYYSPGSKRNFVSKPWRN